MFTKFGTCYIEDSLSRQHGKRELKTAKKKTQLTYKTALFGPSTPENATQEQQTQHSQLGLPEDLL